MGIIKQFGVVALLVLGATLCASTPARAQTFDLTPTGAEAGATGQATLTKVRYLGTVYVPAYWPFKYYKFVGHLQVTCQGLAPGATYATSAGTFTAGSDGTGTAKTSAFYFGYDASLDGYVFGYPEVTVSRINPDGSETPVLYTMLPYPP
jgi:hypothetical protein